MSQPMPPDEKKWTDEKWFAGDNTIHNECESIAIAVRPSVDCTNGFRNWPANRDRIVACANACRDLPDPEDEIRKMKAYVGEASKELALLQSDLHPTWAVDPGNVSLTASNIREGINQLRADLKTLAAAVEKNRDRDVLTWSTYVHDALSRARGSNV